MPLALAYSPDEGFVVGLSVVLWAVTWIAWYVPLGAGSRLRRRRGPARLLALAPLAALALLFAILRAWASFDVRDSGAYLFQYVALGAAWIGLAVRVAPWLGISARDDAAERGNMAAAVALAGALVGLTLCYAGGNVGDGPGWWVVVFSSGLATAAFLASWAVLERAAHASDALTIDRDPAAAARFAAFAASQGLVLGRAVAGDWVSAEATLRDLAARGWPALVVLALAIALERALRPTAEAPRRALVACGLLPGAVLVLGSLAWVAWLGEAA